MKTSMAEPYLKIGDVARKVGVSPSVIRSWESLGLARPRRTESKYRLYTAEDVKLLKRARAERRGDCAVTEARGQSSSRGGWESRGDWRASAPVAIATAALFGGGSASGGNFRGISQRARTIANERLGWNAAQAGAILQNKYSGFL